MVHSSPRAVTRDPGGGGGERHGKVPPLLLLSKVSPFWMHLERLVWGGGREAAWSLVFWRSGMVLCSPAVTELCLGREVSEFMKVVMLPL